MTRQIYYTILAYFYRVAWSIH